MLYRMCRSPPAALLALVGLLSACTPAPQEADTGASSASAGQVRSAAPTSPLSAYAAARAADQVSFGATPALLASLSQHGLSGWITDQMALPVSTIDAPAWVIDYNRDDQGQSRNAFEFPVRSFINLALSGPDQLRLRVSWALMQFIPVNGKVEPYGEIEHFNLLQRHAFGNYASLLRELTIHPAMGWFLDNVSNRPTSPQCPWCAPNENYAREVMQLFSLGVVRLNLDGSIIRNAQGKAIETYLQEDVEDLARAFTGWRFASSPTPLPATNWLNAGKPMEPEEWEPLHDRDAKRILGTDFPAGRSAPQELDAVVAMLMNHPNIAPFVSLRLIQHLVTSNPTPQYIARVSAVFRNNGQGVAGDMRAVVRAVLLDPDARRGDIPGTDVSRFGKLREPMLWYSATLRGLGCTQALNWQDGGPVTPSGQRPFSPTSVFSFYLPTDRAPGSNLLAPEQKLLDTNELTNRLGNLSYLLTNGFNNNSTCDAATLGAAFAASPKTFIDLLSTRYFRGSMPPTLRSNLLELATGQKTWSTPEQGALMLTQYALTTPYFGVIK